MAVRRVLWLVAMLAALTFALAACGDDDDDVGADTTAGAATFTTISEGALTVCTDAPYPPFEFEENGEWTGFDMELVRYIATNLDLELAVTVQPFDGIWLAPQAGTCDMVVSALSIKPEREEASLFSDPYFDADQSLLVRAEQAEEYVDLGSLAGKTIGVQSGTTGADYANENATDSTIREFDAPDALFPALASGQIDAVLQDFLVNLERAEQDNRLVLTAELASDEQYGFATKKDDANSAALMDAVNEQLAAARDDGTYDELFDKWIPKA